jgi:DNA-3-methyladenine glycosylase I
MSNDNKVRCSWCLKDELYIKYHDEEWGDVSHDDSHLFEHLILETFQAGLSWYTVLKKRENFREAFDNFDAEKIAAYRQHNVEALMKNEGIIRYKAKIDAAINNAKRFLEVQKEFRSFDLYIWQFTNYETIVNSVKSDRDFVATSKESDAMSEDMKKRGFKFVGSTTCYAYMQAIGMVNDHVEDCWKKNL